MLTERILVTGSSRGIGRAIAQRLARDGFDIAINGRNESDALLQVQSDVIAMGRRCDVLCFDIAQREHCREIIEQDIEQNGAYYGVVCNAGLARDNAFPAMPSEEWDQVLHTNLDGFYNVLHPLIMPMVRRRKPGRIVTLSSVAGQMGNRGQVNYSAAKAGIIGATKALAVELAKRNITVNCVAPGLIDTDMLSDLPLDEVKNMIPARRLGKVDEVAGAVSFLMSDDASYITRQVLAVNGGMYS